MALLQALSLNSIVNYLFKYQLYKGVFLASTAVHWILYNDCRDGYLSYIYREDKYGVVINYILLTAIKLVDTWSRLLVQPTIDLIYRKAAQASGSTDLAPPRLPITVASQAFKVLAFLAVVKCILFGLIFKHNTSTHRRQQVAHIACAVLFGISTFLARWYEIDLVSMNYYLDPPKYILTDMFADFVRHNNLFARPLRWVGYLFSSPEAREHTAQLFSHTAVLVIFGLTYNFVVGPLSRAQGAYAMKFLTMLTGVALIQHTV
ncbi:hypothetical protein BDZ88DRAFT_434979 [Geranomyces variabilis]|nr:hypothetical protein BDZ88DRAFT_434979 [Geranomyces variabilis]KAJ3135000.1 hypothetical protein HDU90_004325 [Geranomyces variabilis]